MRRKNYVEKAKNTILSRVRFHAPICFDGNLDTAILACYGIDVKCPVFKFEKQLSNLLCLAFKKALKEEKFNLLIVNNSKKWQKKLSNAVFYDYSFPISFVQTVNKLNINYPSSSNYDIKYKDKFFKVNGQILNPQYEDFSLRQTLTFENVLVEYTEFVLSGSNQFVKILNGGKDEQRVEMELNIPLPKGYYYFKRVGKSIMVENLLTKQKNFLNFVCKNAKFSFSAVDGLENSVFSCINVKLSVLLKPKEEDFVFFNFSQQKFAFKNLKEVKNFQNLAYKKTCEIFNVRVKTKNPKFDFFFNQSLPQKIWINWLNFDVDEILEEKYLTYKRLFVRGEESFNFVPFREIGLREIGIFNGEYFKKILVISGNEKFVRVGKTVFHNIDGITNYSLRSPEPMVLCLGK